MINYQAQFEAATGQAFRPGNTIEILQNGEQIFPAMLEAIRDAQTSIEFVTYVYWHSHIATEFADALSERARAGVQVRLLIDAVGGAIMSTRTVFQMERAGVKVAWFRPARIGNLRKLNHRTHRKILVVDGATGFTGGVGIAAQWTGRANSPKNWRDTHCRITGPACADLRAGFAVNWAEATNETLTLTAVNSTGATPVLTTLSGLGPRPTPMERLVTAATEVATVRLWITTAYFVPEPGLIASLVATARRGVDVRLITNGARTNHKLTRFAGRASYGELLAAGVRIFEYQPTVLHVKTITADGAWATLGSANLDNRALVLNDELNISFVDAALTASLDAQFQLDLAVSTEISLAGWQSRPVHERALEAATIAIRSQL